MRNANHTHESNMSIMSNFFCFFISQAQLIRTLWPISYCNCRKKTAIARKQTFLSSNPSSVLLFFLVLCKLVSFDTLPDGRASHSRLYIYINIFRCIGVKWCERFVCASSTTLLYCAHYFSYQRSMFMCLVVKKNTYCYSVFKFIVSWFYDHKELLISAKSSVRFCNLRIVKLIRKRLARATHQEDAVDKKANTWLYFAGV